MMNIDISALSNRELQDKLSELLDTLKEQKSDIAKTIKVITAIQDVLIQRLSDQMIVGVKLPDRGELDLDRLHQQIAEIDSEMKS